MSLVPSQIPTEQLVELLVDSYLTEQESEAVQAEITRRQGAVLAQVAASTLELSRMTA